MGTSSRSLSSMSLLLAAGVSSTTCVAAYNISLTLLLSHSSSTRSSLPSLVPSLRIADIRPYHPFMFQDRDSCT
jgi:hypothetical protein